MQFRQHENCQFRMEMIDSVYNEKNCIGVILDRCHCIGFTSGLFLAKLYCSLILL